VEKPMEKVAEVVIWARSPCCPLKQCETTEGSWSWLQSPTPNLLFW